MSVINQPVMHFPDTAIMMERTVEVAYAMTIEGSDFLAPEFRIKLSLLKDCKDAGWFIMAPKKSLVVN